MLLTVYKLTQKMAKEHAYRFVIRYGNRGGTGNYDGYDYGGKGGADYAGGGGAKPGGLGGRGGGGGGYGSGGYGGRGGGSGGARGRGGGGASGIKKGDTAGSKLRPIDWKKVNYRPVQKNFYHEHASIQRRSAVRFRITNFDCLCLNQCVYCIP